MQLVAAFPNQYEHQSKVFSSVADSEVDQDESRKELALSNRISKQIRLSTEVSLTCLDNPLDAFLLIELLKTFIRLAQGAKISL